MLAPWYEIGWEVECPDCCDQYLKEDGREFLYNRYDIGITQPFTAGWTWYDVDQVLVFFKYGCCSKFKTQWSPKPRRTSTDIPKGHHTWDWYSPIFNVQVSVGVAENYVDTVVSVEYPRCEKECAPLRTHSKMRNISPMMIGAPP